tara:strand:- start:497 stop:745 length:249 start_codon:yes stop_codon:yes gene_type:complete
MTKDGLNKCARQCIIDKKPCTNNACRHFIDYPKEYNCVLVTVYEHGNLTLREVAERIGVSFARIKQIESKALAKLKKSDLAL